MKPLKFVLLMLASGKCIAFSSSTYDASLMAMGDAGRSTGLSGFRAYHNPAMSFNYMRDYRISSFAGGRFMDQDHLVDTFDEIDQRYDNYDLEGQARRVGDAFEAGSVDTTQLRSLADSADQVLVDIDQLSNRYLRIGASFGAQIAYQQPTYTISFFTRNSRYLNGVVQNDPNDIVTIQRLSDLAYDLADTIDTGKAVDDIAHDVEWPLIEDMFKEAVDNSGIEQATAQARARLQDGADNLEDAIAEIELLGDQLEALDWPAVEDVIRERATSDQVNAQVDKVKPTLLESVEAVKAVADQLDTVEDAVKAVDWNQMEDQLKAALEQTDKIEAINDDIIDYEYVEESSTNSLEQLENNVEQIEKAMSEFSDITDETLVKAKMTRDEIIEYLKYFRLKANIQQFALAAEKLEGHLDQVKEHIDVDKLTADLVDQVTGEDEAEPDVKSFKVEDYLLYTIPEDVNTVVIFTGAEVTETAANFSYSDFKLEGLALGVNLKNKQYVTVAYLQKIDEVELGQFDQPASRKKHNLWNMDVGFNYQLNANWSVAGVIKDVFKQTLNDQLGNTITLKPDSQVGVGFQYQNFNVAMDVDLNKYSTIYHDEERQYVSLGGEYGAHRLVKLRAGYRYNLISGKSLPAIGFGIANNQFMFDFAASFSEEQMEGGVATELAYRF